jgi:hypothetical protein
MMNSTIWGIVIDQSVDGTFGKVVQPRKEGEIQI